MEDKVRWGVLGTGPIARRFARSLAGERRSTLVACAGRTEGHVEDFAHEFGAQAADDMEALLGRSDVDAVYIALPNALHAEWSVKALEAGKAVLCEKPAAVSAAEFSRVAQAAIDHDRLYMEAMKPRFTPLYQKVRDLVAQGAIGEVGSVEADNERDLGDKLPRDPVSGGALLDLGCYAVTYLAEFAEGDIGGVSGTVSYQNEVETACDRRMAVGNAACRLRCDGESRHVACAKVAGSTGSIEIEDITRPVKAVVRRDGEPDEELDLPLEGDDLSGEIAHFVDVLLSGGTESPVMSLADSLRCARILDAARSGFDRYAVAEALGAELGDDCVTLAEPMAEHTTFEVGGPADVFVTPKGRGGLLSTLRVLREHGAPFFILGRGSDLLVSDAGYRGVVVDLSAGLDDVETHGDRITCQAGVAIIEASEMAAALSLTGLEFACGIPGSVGGAVFMNAGAYDGCVADVLESCEVVFPDGHVETQGVDDLALGYRTSRVRTDGLTVVSATFRLSPGDGDAIRSKMDDLTRRREEKQPLELPSAGSTFKRPEGHFAGKLIHDAGLMGYRHGGAGVSDKHAGFVVNLDHATAADVRAVIAHVQEVVRAEYDVDLEPEVRFLGPF